MVLIQAELVLMIEWDGFVFGKTIAMMALGGESHAGVLIIIQSQTGATPYCGQTSLLKVIGIQVLCHILSKRGITLKVTFYFEALRPW